MTQVQACSFIETFYKAEVEKRAGVYVPTESLGNSMDEVARFLTEDNRRRFGLFLNGYIGNGKTTMLTCISKIYSFLVSEDYILHKDDYGDCFRMVASKDVFYQFQDDRASFDVIKKSEKLIIDDFGEEPAEMQIYGVAYYPMRDLLMYRYDHRLLTLISSNLNAEQIKQKYRDERLVDRMREMFYVVAFHDKSFRK